MENRKTRKIKKYLDKQLSILEKNNKKKVTPKWKERYDWNGKIIQKYNKGVKSDNVKNVSNDTPDVKR